MRIFPTLPPPSRMLFVFIIGKVGSECSCPSGSSRQLIGRMGVRRERGSRRGIHDGRKMLDKLAKTS